MEPVADDPRTRAIIGAAMEVHNQLGYGFLEAVHQEALEFEFVDRQIPYVREPTIQVMYKCRPLGNGYRPDFFCYDAVIVELKALTAVGNVEMAQVIHYLKATNVRLALLLNFGAPKLEFRRVVR